jgi:D-amino-acid oxidase
MEAIQEIIFRSSAIELTQIKSYRGGAVDGAPADTLTHIRGYPRSEYESTRNRQFRLGPGFWIEISAGTAIMAYLCPPSSMAEVLFRRPKVLIVGAGVSGLTSAVALARRGIKATIVADKLLSKTTSVIAGALWEWPPAVCGFHQNPVSLTRSKTWARHSYEVFDALSANPETGVDMRTSLFFFRRRVEDCPADFQKMNEIRRNVRGFVHSPTLIGENEINADFGLNDAYAHLAPLIDTDRYLAWLSGEVQRLGVETVRETIVGSLHSQQQSLKARFCADYIVNCSGLGARDLGDPTVYPLRGALIRIHNHRRLTRPITKAYCVAHDDSLPSQNMIYIIPRGGKFALLGGLAEPHEWDDRIGLDNYEPIRQIFERCVRFLPWLKEAEIDRDCPVKVGLRPMRADNIRLELESGTSIIHNYGHGGSGVTFSWGCAEEVAALVEIQDGYHSKLDRRRISAPNVPGTGPVDHELEIELEGGRNDPLAEGR